MENRELYKLSNHLNLIVNQSKHLLLGHATRYKHFVDSSDRGFECSYARATAVRYHQDQGAAEVREQLTDLAEQIQTTLRYLDTHDDDQVPAWIQEHLQGRHIRQLE